MKIQRRINHTGRKRIDKSRVDILIDGESGNQTFAASVNFDGLGLPSDSPVFIEAYQSGRYSLQRFDCGTVAAFAVPAITNLNELDQDQPVQFRIKVINVNDPAGKLLAAVRGIRASNEQPDLEGREELLAVWTREMGDVPWKINFQEDGIPELSLNNRIPGAKDLIKHNPLFQALILPSVIRKTLDWIYWNELYRDDQIEWVKSWITFAEDITQVESPSSDDPNEVNAWIEDVVSAFSVKHSLCSRLVDYVGRGDR